jgi:chitin disaccharide deacetylase
LFLNYLELGRQYRLAVFAPSWDEAHMLQMGYDRETATQLTTLLGRFEADGMPLVDHVIGLPLAPVPDRDLYVRQAVENLGPGITHFLFHPLRDTPEIRSMTESWPQRVNDRAQFLSEDLRRFVEQQGIHVIGYRALQALIP